MAAAPDNSALQVFYGTIPLVGAFVLAHLNSIKHWDALNKRIDDLIVSTNAGFSDVKERLGRLEDRVTDIERNSRMVRF